MLPDVVQGIHGQCLNSGVGWQYSVCIMDTNFKRKISKNQNNEDMISFPFYKGDFYVGSLAIDGLQ